MARIRSNGNGAKKKASTSNKPADSRPEPSASSEQSTSEHRAGRTASQVAEQLPPIFRNFADTTSHVVKQAASILEEEVAAGILAARQIENKFINAEELRSARPDEVLQRFRRDAHDVVDILLVVVVASVRNATKMAQRAISIRTTGRNTNAATTSVLTMPQSVKPGEIAEISLVIENDGDATAEPFELRSTDLVSTGGQRIPAHAVTFNPAAITIGPHESQKVVVRVKPPMDTPVGTYSGLIQSTRPDQLRAILSIVIV
jgi:hypothetical protein